MDQRALVLKPDLVNAMEKLGLAYFKQKRYPQAAAAFDQLKIYRPDSKTYNNLGESQFEAGKVEDAIESFNSVSDTIPILKRPAITSAVHT